MSLREATANCMVCLAKKKVINLKMARGKAETCREKLCKNILLITTLNNFFDYILPIYFVILYNTTGTLHLKDRRESTLK
jgi:hypothetical protein